MRNLGLDLMRAAAIAMVLCSHWGCHFGPWFGVAVPAAMDRIGDVGVDVFFALSGFLIGRILIGIAAGRPSLAEYGVFMLRRAMRTLPLYFAWLALLLNAFPPRHDAPAVARRFATLTQNLFAAMPDDYYFAVTWSLAVEEWFYLLFALSFIVLARRSGMKRALAVSLGVFLAVPLALRLAYNERGGLVPFRIDEIGYGVLMAWLYLRGSALYGYPRTCLGCGLALLVASVANSTGLPDGLAVPLSSNAEVIGAALCLPAALRLTRAAWWFAGPVRWVASRSYALYIMHLTILADVVEQLLLEPGLLPAPACVALAVLLPLPLAELSYRLLEEPILRMRPAQLRGRSRRGLIAAAHRRIPIA